MSKKSARVFLILLSLVLVSALVFTAVGCSDNPPAKTDQYTVTVINGTGGGKVDKDKDCTVTATVGAGKVFVKWTIDGKEVSASNPYTFKVTKDVTVTAVLADAFTVTVAGGKIDGKTNVTVTEGSKVTAVADSQAGKRFLGWYNGETLLSSETEYKFTVNSNLSLEAKFVNTYKVTVSGGTINNETSVVVDDKTEVTLTPTVPAGKSFLRWTVDGQEVSASSTYTFTVTADVTVTAEFGELIQLVTPKNDSNQMFTKKPSGYSDMIVEMDRQKDESGNKMTVFVDGVDYVVYYLYTSPTADKNDYVGQFKMVQIDNTDADPAKRPAEIQTMDETLKIGIGSTPGDYFFDRVSNADFYALISAAVGEDYDRFQDYYVAAQAIGLENSLYLSSAISEIGTSAIRQAEAVDVTVVNGTGGGVIEKNTQCTVTATVAEGYYFVKWTVNGETVSTENPYTFNATADITLTAVTEEIPEEQFTVTVNGGIGGGEFLAGEQCTLTPTVPEGKGFVRWVAGGEEVSASYEYTFTVTADVTVTAEFGDLVQVATPANDSNQMFNYFGYGDARNTTEFDRQKDGDQRKTAFVDGVDYVLYYIYTSPDAAKDAYVGTFKMVQTVKGGAAEIRTIDGNKKIGIGSTPGNYYIDNTSKDNFYGFFSAAIGEDFDETQKYYFAAQAIAFENSIFQDSGISEIGTNFIQHTAS